MPEPGDNIFEVVPNAPEPAFRPGLQTPPIAFGRCCVTGEYGKVVNVDLGDICIEGPDVDNGVEYDPDTKKVTFTQFKPNIIKALLSISEAGLRLLLAHSEGHGNPVPAITPPSVYAWRVLNADGSVQSQFQHNEAMELVEQHSGVINWENVRQLSVVPKDPADVDLPTYTLDLPTCRFYKAGVELDVDYGHETGGDGTRGFYARKNTITFGSVVEENMSRSVKPIHITVLQLLGWVNEPSGKKCVIGIDERGNWRPFEYNPE